MMRLSPAITVGDPDYRRRKQGDGGVDIDDLPAAPGST